MKTDTEQNTYSIIFHTAEAFKQAMTLDPTVLDYWVCDEEGIELFWNSKAKRDKAERTLKKQFGIIVDTFEFDGNGVV